MNLLRHLCRASVMVAALSVASAWAASPSNKWRIDVNHAAKTKGEIELSFTPEGAGTTSLVVPIPAGTHENKAAHLIRDAIRAKFGKSVYKTELDDGEDVLVKVRGRTPDVEIVLVRNTAEGLVVNLHRE